ncbi:amidoligase family protein [Pseudidiomarina insulisalsae]|uniref:Amidoligase enzyme n=1 Tax=Pseudidiomarina insulisalsae TaxID=575789 RepID=A0A432YR35_9GAMM|nr:amidoligase family protein [Pseudidiomarina insulisalsae]RUO63742.1 hypothetical protein CWI71_01370 [Pseudidiomarina insulisalsae]
MTPFIQPPESNKSNGSARRVGFELEFSSLDVASSAEAVARAVNGSAFAKSSAHWQVDTDLGSFKVEIDWEFLQRLAEEQGAHANDEAWLDSLSQAASLVVPIEVVCPPIAIDALAPLSDIIKELREAGAKGTDDSFIAAYGTHINPELPDLECATIHAYMQAYALLQWWLVEQHHVNPTRKLSPFIDLYPEAYVRHLLSEEVDDLSDLIEDYLEANPTRNRAFDMLPLFSHLDDERVRSKITDRRIKSRPTLHYRLPNCRIDDADWSLADEWRIYCTIERLVQRPKALAELAQDFLDADRPMLGVARKPWVEHVSAWLEENLASE